MNSLVPAIDSLRMELESLGPDYAAAVQLLNETLYRTKKTLNDA